MITAREDYKDLLYQIQDPNRQTQIVQLPQDEPYCTIDLDSRSIFVPEEIKVVEFDHNSETLYFVVDRFYDNVDLSTVYAVIQYNNADPAGPAHSGFIYPVPFFDITTMPRQGQDDKMIFQWAIEGPVAAYPGWVNFSIQFYRISENEIEDEFGNSKIVKTYDYILNTLPSKIKIQPGMNVLLSSKNYDFTVEEVKAIYAAIEEIKRQSDLYWIIMNDDFDDTKPIVFEEDHPEGTINKSEDIYNIIT